MRSLTHAALEQYLAQEQARRSAQLSLIAEVANAYLTLASDRELQRLAQQTLESQEASFELTQKRHAIGAVSGLDLAQAQTTVESARADAARYEGNIAQDIDALTLLVGAPVDATLLPRGLRGHDHRAAGAARRPAVRRCCCAAPTCCRRNTCCARPTPISAPRARRSSRPSASPPASARRARRCRAVPVRHRHLELRAAATLPLFHGGELSAIWPSPRTEREIAVAQYEKAIQASFREVADALALTPTLERQRQAQEALVSAAAARL